MHHEQHLKVKNYTTYKMSTTVKAKEQSYVWFVKKCSYQLKPLKVKDFWNLMAKF